MVKTDGRRLSASGRSRRPRLGERAFPLAQEMSEDHATHAPAARNAAPDQEAHEPTLMGPALLVLTLVLIFLLAPFAQEMGEKQATQAPATRDAARDQEAHEPTLVGPALLVLTLVVIFLLAPFA